MNTSNNKEAFELSPEELAQLGNGALSYIREIEGRDVIRLVGPQARVAPDAKLFCLFNANGSPISISGTREAAVYSAVEHELRIMLFLTFIMAVLDTAISLSAPMNPSSAV
jgi:hypothetical protein